MTLKKNGATLIERKCDSCGSTFEVEKWKKKKYCNLQCMHNDDKWRLKQSLITKQKYKDGKLVYGGKTKWMEIETSIGLLKVQGSYEVRACKILDRLKKIGKIKEWEYTNDRVSYFNDENEEKTYLIDFKVYLDDGDFYYIEVKGWQTKNDELKWKSVEENGFNLEVWFEKDIKKYEMEYMV